jgi:hypothetical protein
MRFEILEVHSYSGYKHNERPVRFTYKGSTVQIAEIIDQWYEGHAAAALPAMDYYKVKAEGGAIYIIRYNHLFETWAICIPDDTRK